MENEDVEQPKGGGFPATRWSAMCGVGEESRMRALEVFLGGYVTPLRHHLIRQFRLSDDHAAEVLQAFIVNRVVQRDLLSQAERSRGRFRTFILHALNHFVIDERRKASAAKRSPGAGLESLDELSEKDFEPIAPSLHSSFDQEFARAVIHETLTRMRARCMATDRKDLWRVFHERILKETFEGKKPLPYDELAPLLGVDTETRAANLLTTAKRMFARVFKSVIRDYEADPDTVDAEIKSLRHILSNS